jgi:Flp pilus assembly protein TadG
MERLPKMLKRVTDNSSQRGATLYEFAAILPILLFLMVGIIDFGRAMYAYHFVSGAARAATRWAGVRGASCNNKYITPCPAAESDILNFVHTLAPPGMYVSSTAGCTTTTVGCLTINTSTAFIWPGTTTTGGVAGSDCTNSGANPTNTPGCVVQVQVEYTFSFGIPLFKFGNMILSSTSDMVISQ